MPKSAHRIISRTRKVIPYNSLKETLIEKYFKDIARTISENVNKPDFTHCTPELATEKYITELKKIDHRCLKIMLSKQEAFSIKTLLACLQYGKLPKIQLLQITACFGELSQLVIKEYESMFDNVMATIVKMEQPTSNLILIQYNTEKNQNHYVKILALISMALMIVTSILVHQNHQISDQRLSFL